MEVILWTGAIFIVIAVLRATLLTFSAYWLTPRRIRNLMEKQGVRGPPPRLFVGNLFQIASLIQKTTSSDMISIHHEIVSRLLPHYVLWSNQYGKRFLYLHGSEVRLCLTETEMIKELLSSKYSHLFGKSWLQRHNSRHFIGKGLLMANGEDWFHQRQIVSPAFLLDKLKNHSGHMVECTKQMIQSLQTVVKSGETEVDISVYLGKLAGDVIARTEFDTSYEKGKRIFELLTSLQVLCAKSSRYSCFPGSRFLPNKYNREIKQLKAEVEKTLMEIVQSRKDCVEIGRSTCYGNDLLGLLLTQTQKKDQTYNFTLQHLIDECKTFFFTGQETTALLLTWTVMLLATNPSWQDKARAEIFEVCNGQSPSPEHLSKLSLLNMILNESLRLYPPASLLPRQALQDMKLGDLNIPKGLSIWIPVLAIHHSEELWGKDANEFNPDRFAGKTFAPGRHFMPFSAGPRTCIGQAFAMMEAKTVLAMFLSSFSFTISKNYRHAPVSVLTIQPKHGVQIYLKPLNY